MIATDIIIGGVYHHYKGNRYRVIAIAKHSETQEPLVMYQSLTHTNEYWARPLTMFVEQVSVNGHLIPRFQYISDE